MNRRPILIVFMLVASLALIAVLGLQAWRLQQSNEAVARAVQRDYANLAADEYGRRITAALGYRGHFRIISSLAEAPTIAEMQSVLGGDEALSRAAVLVDALFLVSAGEVHADGRHIPPELRQFLASTLPDESVADGPYAVIAATPDHPQIVYAWRERDGDASDLFGYSVSAEGVSEFLRDAFDEGPLLPDSLGNGDMGNEQLYVEVRNAAGDLLLSGNEPVAESQIVEKVMADDYQGVVNGYSLRVAVDPAAAGRLVIGGLPAGRLPLLGAITALAVALLLTAIWLLRREQAVMKMRSDFVSQVSHELRTPLTQIRMFAETLLLGRMRSGDERERALRIIDRESRRLSQLVENILLFSKISDSLEVEPRPQSVAVIVREVCEATSFSSPDVDIQVIADDDAVAEVDGSALRQVLLNVLDNAIKNGPSGQRITVTVSERPDFVRVEIADEGPGIAVAERERVWEAFYRPDSERRRATSGTGIGLAVVRELVTAMHGRCRIADSGPGCCVIVELPRSSAVG